MSRPVISCPARRLVVGGVGSACWKLSTIWDRSNGCRVHDFQIETGPVDAERLEPLEIREIFRRIVVEHDEELREGIAAQNLANGREDDLDSVEVAPPGSGG